MIESKRRLNRRRVAAVGALLLLFGLVASASDTDRSRTLEEHVAEAREAYAAEDHGRVVEALGSAVALAPGHPRLELALVRALIRDDRPDEAFARLSGLVRSGLELDLDADESLSPLWEHDGFRNLAERMRDAGSARVASLHAFRWDTPDFIPEGIAHDPTNGNIFVSSVHRREIVMLNGTDEPHRIADATDGLGAVLGLRVDPARGRLWAISADLPQMIGFDEVETPGSALIGIDLASLKTAVHYALPEGSAEGRFNDLELAEDGTLFVSDSVDGAIYRLIDVDAGLQAWLPAGTFRSPGGMAATKDGRHLYVADWSRGLFRVSLTGEGPPAVETVSAAAGGTLYGIDGLLLHRGALIAIQNGQRPHGVLRLILSDTGERVERFEVLERNHPEYDEPTLGVIAGDDLLYIANSHWPRFDRSGALHDADSLSRPLILRLPLD